MAQSINHPTNSHLSPSLWDWLTAPNASIAGLTERRQARLSAVVALALIIFNVVSGITSSQRSSNIFQVFGIPIIITLIAYIIIKTRFFTIGSFLLIVCFCASGYLNIITNSLEISTGILFFIPVALTIGSAIVSSRVLFLLTGLNIAVISLFPLMGVELPNNISSVIGLVIFFGLVLVFINYSRKNIELQQLSEFKKINQELIEVRTDMQQLMEERTIAIDRRAARLESAALVARVAAETRDMKELMDNITKQIGERFGFYHVGIFLADENNLQLNLVAASSQGGQKMLARGHKLGIGREGIVGFAAYQKRPHIAQNVGSDTVFINNLDLPNTHSEAALPLLAQNRLIGVLDIQSEAENAFTPDDVSTLQTMTDQIALAIENIRLVEQSRSAFHNLESINVDKIARDWRERLGSQVIGFTYTPFGVKQISDENLVGNMEDIESQQTFKIPINLRGKEIGSISLMRKSNESTWAETEKEMVRQIATQVALAIENARLLEESQSRAVREQTVNEFTSRFSRSLDIDTLLQNAVQEIYRLPQVSQVSLFINPIKETLKPE